MQPGFCITTEVGRERLAHVQKAVQEYAHRGQTYLTATAEYESRWLRAAQEGPEALSAYEEAQKGRIDVIVDSYNAREVIYQGRLVKITADYMGQTLAIHYEGAVKWWQAEGKGYRVFKRLLPGELEEAAGQDKRGQRK